MNQEVINFLSSLPGMSFVQNPYLFAIVILVLFVILAVLVIFIFGKYLDKIASKTKTKIDDLLLDHTKKPLFFLIVVYGIKLSLAYLNFNGIVSKIVNSILAIIFVTILLRIFDVIVETWGDALAKKTRSNIDDVLLPLFQKTAKVVFVIIAIMWVLNIWGIDITPYLAGVGISGLVLGLALQDSLRNVFGGVSLLLDKNFHLGDPIKLESGELGKILEIGLRSTKMLTFDNEVIFIPNGQLANMRIHNYLRPNSRVRKVVKFSVAYGTSVDKVQKVALSAMKKVKNIFDDPYMDVIFIEMADSSLNFQARFFADWDDAYGKWLEVTDAIHTALNEAGIEIPFPTRTIYMKK